MLGRASQRYQATAAAAPPPKSDLGKQLFPSSSPSVQDGNLAGWASKKGSTGYPSSSTASLKAGGPLNPKSDNPSAPRRPQKRKPAETGFLEPFQSGGFMSLYPADSFKDEPAASRKAADAVYIAEDDFSSDDEQLLKYEAPASKPYSPPLPKARPAPSHLIEKPSKPPPPPTSDQAVPWSSSPQEHLYPPPRNPLKRESPTDAAPAQAPVKKRVLPANFKEPEVLQTPAPKNPMPWNTTYSAAKEKKKQLKGQARKPELEELSVDEVISSHPASSHHVKAKASAISLSAEQLQVLHLVMQEKKSVFFTGPAGTGKSVLMRAIIAEMKKKWARTPERLSITASTGLAACNIGGMTLHSFAGIGLGKDEVPELVRKIRRNRNAKDRWLKTTTLVIDEISMVDGELFDKLALVAKIIRNNGRPWGGIQLVITGDFFQLPPVPDNQSGKKGEAKFAFDAETWSTSIDHTIGLTEVFRQRDPGFADMLNEMRLGRINDSTLQAFKALQRELKFEDGLDVTELFPTRQEVERSNESRLRNLPGEVHHFPSFDSGDPSVRDKLLANMMAPKSLDLKKGAQVMLVKNLDDTLVNGSLGIVRGFMSEATFALWSGRDEGSGDEADQNSAAKKIKGFGSELSAASLTDTKEYPLVKFTGMDGTHRTMLLQPEDWKVELSNGEIQAQRRQLPLILAWALSIHKAQGQTLERVKVDLGKVFEKGQAYVALSRAVSKDGLQVLNFNKNKVQAHPRVIQFYNQLYSASSAIKTKAPAMMSEFTSKAKAPATLAPNAKAPATNWRSMSVTEYASSRKARSQIPGAELPTSKPNPPGHSDYTRAPNAPSARAAVPPKSRSSGSKNVDVIHLDDDEEAMAAAYG